ncbi:MAG: aldehyde dehydrogenase family protein [Cohaesibacteraceae bacterium]|nr:aldehyde dehydrogenase family protein [Cohaesibacteraceae bacterium]MBL4876545.1 aldehyde dehydrogenase family protein [Cohaesibacteraceae bacterium]
MTQSLSKLVGEGLAYFNVINGKRIVAVEKEVIEVVCPSDGKVFCTIPRSRQEDVNRAVDAARLAFNSGPWAELTAVERGRILHKWSQLILENLDELAALESRDTGKPVRQGIADIRAAARYYEFYAGAVDKIHGDTIPVLAGHTALTLREPHGVVGAIIPWNYPSQIMGRIAGAALAMGNTLVIKPAEDACLSVIRIAELALDAGLPAGVLNVVTGYGEEAGAPLTKNVHIDFLTFTGSPDVGMLIQHAAARNHIGCTLELGGKSPQILFEDADLDAAIPVVVNAIIQNSGQTCSAGSRVLVSRKIVDQVSEELGKRFSSLVAAPHHEDGDLGPVVSTFQRVQIERMVAVAAEHDVPLIAKGTISSSAPKTGYYIAPMLFGPVRTNERIAQEEIFGPVLALIVFDDEEEAINIANGTPFGLVAGVWTRDGSRAMRVARKIRAGQIFINGYGAGGGVELPFGGFKKSGHGREKGFEALYEFSATKTIVINHG